jgi:hypothetical protein
MNCLKDGRLIEKLHKHSWVFRGICQDQIDWRFTEIYLCKCGKRGYKTYYFSGMEEIP